MSSRLAKGIVTAVPSSVLGWMFILTAVSSAAHALSELLTR